MLTGTRALSSHTPGRCCTVPSGKRPEPDAPQFPPLVQSLSRQEDIISSHAHNLAHFPGFGCPHSFLQNLRLSFTSIQHADASTHTKGKLTRSYQSGKNTSKKCLVFCNLSHYSLKSYNLTSKHIKLFKLLTLK